MSITSFVLLLFGAFAASFFLLIGSYLWTRARFNRALKKHLASNGYNVTKIRSTDFKFHVEPKSINKGVSFGTAMFKNGSTGSGLHFRKVFIRNDEGDKEFLYAAIEVQFFRPVEFHIL